MQIGHRWTSTYLIEKHMCGTFKNNNSYISLCFSSLVHSPGVTCDCEAGVLPRHLWNYSNEDTMFLLFTASNGDKNKVGAFMNTISHFHSRATTTPPPVFLPLSENTVVALEERPGHYEKPLMSVWRGVLWCAAYYSHSSGLGDTWQADSQQVV